MKYQYARLCLILVLSLLLGLPLRESGYGVGVIGVLSIAGIYTAACAAGSTRSRRRVYLVAILPTVLITLQIALFGAAAGLALAGTALVLGFLAFAAVAILLRLAQQDRVTADTVLGGICVYLLIGFVFFYLFDMVELIHPGAFLERDQRLRPPVNAEHLLIRRPELNYFSFVTLTTVGFGDITPVDPLARVLTVLEALFGQIYLVTFLAFLVGNYISQRDASKRVTALPSSPRIASGQDVDGGEARDKAATNAAEG
jgi:hypothetical protein